MIVSEFLRQLEAALDAVVRDAAPGAPVFGDSEPDSLMVLQLILAIEEIADCDAPPHEPPLVLTLADAYDYYQSLASGTIADVAD